jgi:hypothetical protein
MTGPQGMRCPIRTHNGPGSKGTCHDLLNPDPSRLNPREIAYHLARINRFVGASDISVAEHCVRGAQYILDHGHLLMPGADQATITGTAYAFLLHDAHEAIVGDVSSPAKRAMRALRLPPAEDDTEYHQLEELWASAVCIRFEVDSVQPRRGIVHQVDREMGRHEAERAFTDVGDEYGPRPAYQVRPGNMGWQQAYLMWLTTYRRLAVAVGLTVLPTEY